MQQIGFSGCGETIPEEALELLQLCPPYFNVVLFVNASMLKDNFKKMQVGEAKEEKKNIGFGESAFLEKCNIFDVFFVEGLSEAFPLALPVPLSTSAVVFLLISLTMH